MSFEYLPIMAQAGAPKPPRVLVPPSKQAWSPITKPVNQSTIALLSSAALRLQDQEPFVPREDLSYRRIPADPPPARLLSITTPGSAGYPNRIPKLFFHAPRLPLWRSTAPSAQFRRFISLSWAAFAARKKSNTSWPPRLQLI